MSRFDDVIDGLAQQLVEEWERLDSLSPEDRAAELAHIEAGMTNGNIAGPCVQAPAQRKRGSNG